ncbi:hypothetical protein CK203_021727 [Vitis vinifera]|uniref:Uncharacterized protein n=1 Tax=Vitis vinifera TaxID=29760 RepID=A0A438J4V1_VITVI|nr:hypothetical protein CK203_021727 [Vitis vinifera]
MGSHGSYVLLINAMHPWLLNNTIDQRNKPSLTCFVGYFGRYFYGHWCCHGRICFMLASKRIWAFRFLKDGNTIALFTYDSFDGRMIRKSGNLRTMQHSESEFEDQLIKEKPTPIVESIKEEPDAGWPSFGQLIIDLSKFTLEALTGIFLYFIPSRFMPTRARKGLTPLKDHLIMPEDEADPPLAQKQRAPPPLSETRQAHTPNTSEKYSEMKPPKIKSYSFKDPALSSKHRSSKRQEYAEFYHSGEFLLPTPKSGPRARKKEAGIDNGNKSGEMFGAVGAESKPVEIKAVDYDDPKFDHYNIRSKYGSDDSVSVLIRLQPSNSSCFFYLLDLYYFVNRIGCFERLSSEQRPPLEQD